MRRTFARGAFAPAAVVCLSIVAACAVEGEDDDAFESSDPLTIEQAEQCSSRLAIAFTGTSASPALLASIDPQTSVNALLGGTAFIERFSRFMNMRLNPEPGTTAGEDASYYLIRYILQNNRPYAELFTGGYDVDAAGAVTTAANGLGYFRSRAWMVRYAGNELAGYRIVGGYRILQNTTGLNLSATTNVVGVDLSAKGREAPACRGCHYDGWFALDKVARVLGKRQGTGDTMTFAAPSDGPQVLLDNRTITNDKELVTALVGSEHFKFNTCRHVFNFLYGRDETTAEATVFDKCVDALSSDGTIQAALSAVAKDSSFCLFGGTAPPPATCTSFTYSAYGECQPNGTQTRTVVSSSPAGCTGGSPVTSRTCTYLPPAVPCTSFTYSAFGPCMPDGTQTRTMASSSPAGCTGGSPVLSQTCTYVPPGISFSTQVQPIFTASCTGCHGGGVPPNLTAGNAYASIVNVNASFCATAKYVVPGQSAQSWLVAKITSGGSVGTCTGGSMAQHLNADQRNTITTWVQQGAANN